MRSVIFVISARRLFVKRGSVEQINTLKRYRKKRYNRGNFRKMLTRLFQK